MSDWISFPRGDGVTSRQAHADLPRGTYERELGRDGFAGPATHIYHAHPPTGWIEWEGPLRLRAFDAGKLGAAAASPWAATTLLSNGHLNYRLWRADAASFRSIPGISARPCRVPSSGAMAVPTSIMSSWCTRRAAPCCPTRSGPTR